MEKLDLKDKKILYHLDLDSRQSFRSLGKKVGLSKDIITSRVKKLQEKGIIKGFFAIVDYPKIGFDIYRFYFTFQNVTPDLKKEIIEYFINDKFVGAVKSLEGSYDLMVALYVKTWPQAHSFWQNTLKQYGRYILNKVFTAFSQEESYANRFLLDEKGDSPTIVHQWFDSGKKVELDDFDYKIIKLISENTRLSTIYIAKALDTTSTKVHYRLKKLKELNIIKAYRIQIDFSKLGYYRYKVDIELNQFDKIDNILKYIKSNPNFTYICRTIGYVDLEIVFLLNNSYQLNQIMEDLSSKFPDCIKNYSYFSVIETYKDYVGFRTSEDD
jgi:Lrp/AsnC family leucine-responsive transcriptional regulator